MGVLRMINTANFPLHMAHLEDKGNGNFNSEFVFATTNRTFFEWKSLVCSEAYVRRFKLSFLQVPRVEYCLADSLLSGQLWDRRIDLTKVPVLEEGFELNVSEFFPYSFHKDRADITGESLTFE
jgi:hypothetical protein